MAYDYTLLEKRIDEVFGNQENFAIAMKVTKTSINLKINGKTPWKQSEISKAKILLKIKNNQIYEYFFKPKVKAS